MLEDEDEHLKLSELNDLEYTQENDESLSQAQFNIEQAVESRLNHEEDKNNEEVDSIQKYISHNKIELK